MDKWNQLKDCTVIFLNNEGGWFKSVRGVGKKTAIIRI